MASTMRFDRWEDTLGNSVNMTQVSGGSGLVPVFPSSVSVGSGTASVSSIGTVTVSSASSINLNNVFTSAYRNYRIVFNISLSTTGSSAQFRMRASGSDNSGGNYYYAGYAARDNASFGSWSSQANNNLDLGRFGAVKSGVILDVYQPTETIQTWFSLAGTGYDATSQLYLNYGGQFAPQTSMDGFSIIAGGGTLSGTFTVYGYR